MSNPSSCSFSYPFAQPCPDPWNLSLRVKARQAVSALLPVRHKKRQGDVRIWSAAPTAERPLSEDDFPLIFVLHNAKRFLPSFLQHYRGLGVTRFLCVDDASRDGGGEYLLQQPDVDVHHSNVRYREAARSKTWRELLARKYGLNRWYLNVDVDEYLFTGRNTQMPIAHYAKRLQQRGILRLPAPMIDMIPQGPVSQAVFDAEEGVMPWEICAYFDSGGYEGYTNKGNIKLYGGPRHRLWGAQAELIKYPLLYWDKHTSMGVSIHAPRPLYRNFAPVCGALLHFKIFSDIKASAEYARQSGQYFGGGTEYQLMLDYFNTGCENLLSTAYSRKFTGESDLLEAGMVLPV